MNKLLLSILLLTLTCVGCTKEDQDITGSFVTNPQATLGFTDTHLDVVKKTIERLTWKIEIDDEKIKVWFSDNDEPLEFEYETNGKYILAKNVEDDFEMYVPFYIKNKNTIYGYSFVFFRE
ncbi:MAG: hypothetical protein GY694_21525 [Gammaproteobacteria bacterium]|nr:hypothetical protein [Gammaproteobacteria bacterium]